MSNPTRDHPSVRVHAPPGGQSSNIFGTEFEQSAANKKKNIGSDIFGTNKQDNAEPAPAKQNRNTGSSIFGTEPAEANKSAGTLAGQYKQSQMKSNIFGTDEPTTARVVSDKTKSNVFGTDDKDEQKRQAHVRQGLRDPNASRMGYNPINGEAYSMKDNASDKQTDSTVKKPEEEISNGQTAPENGNGQTATENGNSQAAPTKTTETSNGQAASTNTTENKNVQKPVEKADDNNAQKGVHTSVRVFHPPGGKSNGPLW